MQKKYSYNSIISFTLILSIALTPLSLLPKRAEAQARVSGYTRGLAPAIASLPQCKNVIDSGMKSLFSGIGSLFSNESGGEFDEVPSSMNVPASLKEIPVPEKPTLDTSVSILDLLVTSGLNKATNPSVNDAEGNRLQKEANAKLERIAKTSEEINENSSCLQSIGRLITKSLLQKLTQSTVNWINSGFDGSPAFVQDPEKFFGDIAKNEILQFGIEIEGISPFSKDWMRSNALAMKNKFADNARYSLNELIKQTNPEYDAITFREDFSKGGWDAWTALTQVPANNPLGAKLMFDNEIQKRLAGTSQSVAQNIRDSLKEANGFLGDQRCADPKGVTKEEDQKGLEERSNLPQNPEGQMQYVYINRICNKWEYVTPGKMISEAATNVIGYQNNALLNVEDLNDAIAAVLDATLNQFSTSIYEKGFANLNYQGIDGVLTFNSTGADLFKTQTEKDFMPSHLSSSWLQANPDFNIRTDLTQALIDEQRTYSDKLALQNKELMSTDNGGDYNFVCPGNWTGTYPDCKAPEVKYNFWEGTIGNIGILQMCPSGWTGTYPDCKAPKVSNAYGLMPAIYQLDYCIPGPHPGWEQDSLEILSSKVNSASPVPEYKYNPTTDIVNSSIGVGLQAGGDAILPGLGSVLGLGWGMLSSTFGGRAENESTKTRQHYTNIFNVFTGYRPQAVYGVAGSQVDVNMSSNEGLFFVLKETLNRYATIMNKTYFSKPSLLPEITKEAAREFEKLPGYNQMINENNEKILSLKSTINILGEIKDAVDALNVKLETGQIDEDKYEEAMKFQINTFGRLSASMVNGDDIASADDLAKQIVLKKDYIYKNLLKGPYGCEAFLQNKDNIKPFPSAGTGVRQESNDWDNFNINSIKRMTYPFPIIYDYNTFATNETLPDPWESGYKNTELPKMPSENKYNKYGPGFLPFVHFGAVYDCNKGNYKDPSETCDSSPRTNTYNGSERLNLSNLVNDFAPGYQNEDRYFSNVSVGEVGPEGGGPFEKTIGIY